MRTSRTLPPVVRELLPWLAGWFGFQALVALAGRLTAWRTDVGDESTTTLRRTRTHAGIELRPTHPELNRVRLDLAMAGGELDLTAVPPVDGGIDVTVRAMMAGLAVRVPAECRVWWEFRGVGGIGADAGVQRTDDERGADVRLHATVLFAGVGVESSC